MSVIVFTIEFVAVFFATLYILHYYGNLRKQHWLVTLAVFVAWFFSFLIVFVLPLDVSSTSYKECLLDSLPRNATKLFPTPASRNQSYVGTVIPAMSSRANLVNSTVHNLANCKAPWSMLPTNVLPALWRVIYWSSQILSWFLLPIMQSYAYAGEFTVWGKLKRALYENALWYGSYLIIFGGLLIYVAVRPDLNLDMANLSLIGITASNTWGLLLLVLLLGYGLVELPREAWHISLPDYRLTHVYFKISKLSTEKEEVEEELANVLEQVKRASEDVSYKSSMRRYINTIISKCPPGSEDLFSKGTDDFVDFDRGASSSFSLSTSDLVKLHRKVIVLTQRANRTHVKWNRCLRLAFHLEDIENSRNNPEKIFKVSFSDHTSHSLVRLRSLWLWEIKLKPVLAKCLSIVLCLFSVSLVWSELTFFSVEPRLSIFALMIHESLKQRMFLYIELASFVTIAYMCCCTYYTVFKIKFFNYYYFEPKHQTDPNSLLFSGLLLCRLTYALSLNFLAVIHMDWHVTATERKVETSFTEFMGHMDVLSFIAKGFNVYYPMIVLLVCFFTYFNLCRRFLHCIGIEQFVVDDDVSSDSVKEGKQIVKREKRRIQREINGKDWSERSQGIREKYRNFSRSKNRQGNARIDDEDCDDDDDMIDPSGANSSSTRINVSKISNYTKDSDKIKLLSDVGYAPPDTPPKTSRGYEDIKGSTRSSVPKNIFDDA